MNSYRLTTEKSWSKTLDDLAETFRKWRVSDWTVTPMRPSASRWPTEEQRRVTLHYSKDGAEVILQMTKQSRAVDNLRVLYLAVEAMRMNDVRGIADTLREAYLQLPAPPKTRDPYEVLGVRPDSPVEVLEAAYRALAKKLHPDAGGSEAGMKDLNEAMERIKQERDKGDGEQLSKAP